jgi:hypothetical protein
LNGTGLKSAGIMYVTTNDFIVGIPQVHYFGQEGLHNV